MDTGFVEVNGLPQIPFPSHSSLSSFGAELVGGGRGHASDHNSMVNEFRWLQYARWRGSRYLSDPSKETPRSVKQQALNYALIDGILYRRGKDGLLLCQASLFLSVVSVHSLILCSLKPSLYPQLTQLRTKAFTFVDVPKANGAPRPGRLEEFLASCDVSDTRRGSSSSFRALVSRPLHKPLAEKALIAFSPSFVAKPRSQVSESARAFSKNPAPMGIRPGRPSLYAGASWALPRSPIRCLDHLVWSAPIVFGQRSLHSFTLVHPALPRAFCSSNVKGGRPFVKAQESAGHLSGGIGYPHPIEVPFFPP
ncbi:hypothetical protein ACFE04_019407 [Oxalis oulophora]